jgi:hypothetical protein
MKYSNNFKITQNYLQKNLGVIKHHYINPTTIQHLLCLAILLHKYLCLFHPPSFINFITNNKIQNLQTNIVIHVYSEISFMLTVSAHVNLGIHAFINNLCLKIAPRFNCSESSTLGCGPNFCCSKYSTLGCEVMWTQILLFKSSTLRCAPNLCCSEFLPWNAQLLCPKSAILGFGPKSGNRACQLPQSLCYYLNFVLNLL